MKKVVFGASRPRKFKILAELIMWWEETPASHSYFYIEISKGIWLLYQAVGAGTEFVGYDKFLEINLPIYEKEVEISDEQQSNLISFLTPRLKTKYSILHLFGLFIKRLVKYTLKKDIANYFKDQGKSEVCVEAVCIALRHVKISDFAEDPEDVGMQEVLKIIKTIPGKVLVS